MLADGRLRLTSVDTLGAGLLYATLFALTADEPESWQAALTWRGDRIWLFQHPDHGVVTSWRVHAPGLQGSPIAATLAVRTDPPRLEGPDLLYWSPDLPGLADALRASLPCRQGGPR